MATLTRRDLSPGCADALALLQEYQRRVDEVTWDVTAPDAHIRHIGFHLTIAAAKMARVEERRDHGVIDDAILDDVVADLMIYALQLANLRERDIVDLYQQRTQSNLTGMTKHGPA